MCRLTHEEVAVVAYLLWLKDFVRRSPRRRISTGVRPSATCVSVQLRAGMRCKVRDEAQYFADLFETPAQRSQWVGRSYHDRAL